MPKQKTHKGLAKRVKITGGGKIKRRRAGSGHLMSGKSGNRCRMLRKNTGMVGLIAKKTIQGLGG